MIQRNQQKLFLSEVCCRPICKTKDVCLAVHSAHHFSSTLFNQSHLHASCACIQLKVWLQGLTAHLASASKLAPPTASAVAAQKWVAAAGKLIQQSVSFRADYLSQLKQCEDHMEETVQNAFTELGQQASTSSHTNTKIATFSTVVEMLSPC